MGDKLPDGGYTCPTCGCYCVHGKIYRHEYVRMVRAEERLQATMCQRDAYLSAGNMAQNELTRAKAKIATLVEELDWLARQYQKETGTAYISGKVLPLEVHNVNPVADKAVKNG